jgi:hypothetical protein
VPFSSRWYKISFFSLPRPHGYQQPDIVDISVFVNNLRMLPKPLSILISHALLEKGQSMSQTWLHLPPVTGHCVAAFRKLKTSPHGRIDKGRMPNIFVNGLTVSHMFYQGLFKLHFSRHKIYIGNFIFFKDWRRLLSPRARHRNRQKT